MGSQPVYEGLRELCARLESAVQNQRWSEAESLILSAGQRIGLSDGLGLRTAFRAFPEEWLEKRPLLQFYREVLVSTDRGFTVPSAVTVERLARWVESQAEPSPKEVILAEAAKLPFHVFVGNVTAASAAVARIDAVVASAADYRALDDNLPIVYLVIGAARLTAGELAGAFAAFAESRRWSRVGLWHPAEVHASNYMALVSALEGRFVRSRELVVPWSPIVEPQPTAYAALYQADASLIPALVAIGELDRDSAMLGLEGLHPRIDGDDLWWVAAYARARFTLLWGDRRAGIREVQDLLSSKRALTSPETAAAQFLRSVLSDLLQAEQRFEEADAALDPVREKQLAQVRISAARLDLARGKALRTTSRSGRVPEAVTPAEIAQSMRSTWLQGDDEAAQALLPRLVKAIRTTGDLAALIECDPRSFEALEAHFDAEELRIVPRSLFPAAASVLTPREREILITIEAAGSVSQAAAELFISTNTAKTHLRTAYRKLGVNNRKEAMRRLNG